MPDAVALRGRRLLVVEDEYVIAADLTASLEALGVEVAGPAASVAEALTLLENDGGVGMFFLPATAVSGANTR
jgi:CheY-like chemotaxis protein